MKTAIAFLLLTASAFAAEPSPPPSPPHVWHVWGYKWDGTQWVKQADHCLATSNFQQAADYLNELDAHHDWAEADDLPSVCYTFRIYDDSNYPKVPNDIPAANHQVWAFQQIDGKWVKQESYCHEFRIAERAQQYQASVNAVPGWCATSDLPPQVPLDKQRLNLHKPVVDFPYPYWYTTDADGTEWFHWNDGTVYYYHHHHH